MGNGYIERSFLDHGTSWRLVVSFRPNPLEDSQCFLQTSKNVSVILPPSLQYYVLVLVSLRNPRCNRYICWYAWLNSRTADEFYWTRWSVSRSQWPDLPSEVSYGTVYKLNQTPRANYTDWAAAACLRRYFQILWIEGATWSAWRILTAVF
jgi:hypothetical protein